MAELPPSPPTIIGPSFLLRGRWLGQQSTLVLHWNGISWKIVPSPNPVKSNFRADILFGGTVIPQGDLWLVGNEFGRTLALNATGQ